MRIYFAAPLFSEAETRYNERVCGLLEDAGHSAFLPQRDGWSSLEQAERDRRVGDRGKEGEMTEIFRLDREEVLGADVLTAILDGQVPDEGVAVEMAMAHENDIPVVGLKTDSRGFRVDQPINAMLHGVLDRLVEAPGELVDAVEAVGAG